MYRDTSINPTYANNQLSDTSSPDCLAHFVAPHANFSAHSPSLHGGCIDCQVDFGYISSSCSYESPTSLTSMSSRCSLHNNLNVGFHQIDMFLPTEYFDSDTSRVTKGLSTHDLKALKKIEQQQHNSKKEIIRSESPLSKESSSYTSSIIQAIITKAYPCTPQQKKEKIDKYRCKRTQRNFNKKIKYECRKTLADSRPRIRGRFAKNEETENAVYNENNNTHQYWINQEDQLSGDIEIQLDDDINWVHFLNAFSSNLIP